jgi:thiol-disulfide isomerase/thioredoxin
MNNNFLAALVVVASLMIGFVILQTRTSHTVSPLSSGEVLASAGNTKITEPEVNELILDQLNPVIRYKIRKKAIDYIVSSKKLQGPVTYFITEPLFNNIALDNHPLRGDFGAKVTIVEFLDFQCPYCKAAVPVINELFKQYPNKIRLVTINFPLPFHNSALPAANAALCANEQGKYWQFYDTLFADQTKLSIPDMKKTAKVLGLNTRAFDSCVDSNKYSEQVQQDVKTGQENSVTGTPTFIVDGRLADSFQSVFTMASDEVKSAYEN